MQTTKTWQPKIPLAHATKLPLVFVSEISHEQWTKSLPLKVSSPFLTKHAKAQNIGIVC